MPTLVVSSSNRSGPLQAIAQRRPVGVALPQARDPRLEIGQVTLELARSRSSMSSATAFVRSGRPAACCPGWPDKIELIYFLMGLISILLHGLVIVLHIPARGKPYPPMVNALSF